MAIDIHPALPLFIAAALIPFLREPGRKTVQLIVPFISFVLLASYSPGRHQVMTLLGVELCWLRIDQLGLVFAYIFLIMGFLGNLYALQEKSKSFHVAATLYVASSLGVVLAGDLLTLFIFWELAAVSATFLVWNRNRVASFGASLRYLLVHLAGGLSLFAGVAMIAALSGDLSFNRIALDRAGWLIFLAFALNAAIPPLNAWLPDAYPESTPWGGVYLSAFTTKAAVYALARGFAGADFLVWLGAFMALYGVIFAVLENDIRRLLSYHIISQVGYMVCGVGLGTDLGLNGASAHAFCHILYKGLLFMAAGAVVYATGKSKLTELGGLLRPMPLTFIFYNVGALSISGAPLFNGFVSKSMVVTAVIEEHRGWIELLLLAASMGTFLHTGLKLPYFTFQGKLGASPARKPSWNMNLAMAIASFLCLLIGVYPDLLYRFLPFEVDYVPYTARHVSESLQILLGTAVGFLLLIGKLGGEPSITLDTDWFYRKGSGLFVRRFCMPLRRSGEKVEQMVSGLVGDMAGLIKRSAYMLRFRPLGWSLSLMMGVLAMVILILLSLYS